MRRVRNTTERRYQLAALIPCQGPGAFSADCVTIEPGTTVEVEDRFLETDGARAYVAEGALVVDDAQPAEAEGEQGGESDGEAQEGEVDEAGAETDAQPARGRKRRGGE